MKYESGQILTYQVDAKRCGVCKVIKVTQKDEDEIISLIVYRFWSEQQPTEDDLKELSPFIIHVPVAKAGVDHSNCTLIKNDEVSEDELKGYNNWLKAWQEGKTSFFPLTISASVDYIFEDKSRDFCETPNGNSHQSNLLKQRLQREGMGVPF